MASTQYQYHRLGTTSLSHGKQSCCKYLMIAAGVIMLIFLLVWFMLSFHIISDTEDMKFSVLNNKHVTNLNITKGLDDMTCEVLDEDRFDCYPGGGASKEACEARGCCWKPPSDDYFVDVPYCFFSSGYSVYKLSGQGLKNTSYGQQGLLNAKIKSPWPKDITKLSVELHYETDSRIRLKLLDATSTRYEVPINVPDVTSKSTDTNYAVTYTVDPFTVTVTRKSNGVPVFDTNIATSPLLYADQFLQLATTLTSPLVYGIGEQRGPLLHNVTQAWKRISLWNRDQPPAENGNLYGTHPFFINMEDDGAAHGIFVLNSNAMEFDLQPAPAATVRTIGGILDIYVFLGPTPDSVVAQYLEVVGQPLMPPYWSLGYHQCRWGYNDSTRLQQVINDMRQLKFPMDTQWNDIDYMEDHMDWTYDKTRFSTLPEVVHDLHNHSQKYVIMLDPAISSTHAGVYPPYDEGIKQAVFIMNGTGQPAVGKVWPGWTVFPDFTKPETYDWWLQSARDFYTDIKFDGIWIDMNEPSNFVAGSTMGCPSDDPYNNPPYTPGVWGGTLSDKTLCPSFRQHTSNHYNLHNLYGYTEAVATNRMLQELQPGKRPFIISRSTFSGQGVYSGHWTGDNYATWDDLKYSIAGIINFQLFGIPLVGADICGFQYETNEELCVRWYQLAVFYPFMRNHNSINLKDQDPTAFSVTAQNAIRRSLQLRYQLIPYLYTLFSEAHSKGAAVVRPMAFQYPHDEICLSMDTQWMWGTALMMAPVYTPGVSSHSVYFPNDTWYSYDTGEHITNHTSSQWLTVNATYQDSMLYVRGGSVIATRQSPVLTTAQSITEPFTMISALCHCGCASGRLYIDDGETFSNHLTEQATIVEFTVNNGTFTSEVSQLEYTPAHVSGSSVAQLYVYGVQHAPHTVMYNNNRTLHYVYNDASASLQISLDSATLLQSFTVSWE